MNLLIISLRYRLDTVSESLFQVKCRSVDSRGSLEKIVSNLLNLANWKEFYMDIGFYGKEIVYTKTKRILVIINVLIGSHRIHTRIELRIGELPQWVLSFLCRRKQPCIREESLSRAFVWECLAKHAGIPLPSQVHNNLSTASSSDII